MVNFFLLILNNISVLCKNLLQVTVNEEVKDICQGYKVGDSIPFTAYFNAVFDPEQAPAAEDVAESEEVTADSE